ncbi:hypothetical protein VTO42DRAFT_3384 [Malbranchea cinnamomea]
MLTLVPEVHGREKREALVSRPKFSRPIIVQTDHRKKQTRKTKGRAGGSWAVGVHSGSRGGVGALATGGWLATSAGRAGRATAKPTDLRRGDTGHRDKRQACPEARAGRPSSSDLMPPHSCKRQWWFVQTSQSAGRVATESPLPFSPPHGRLNESTGTVEEEEEEGMVGETVEAHHDVRMESN